MQHKFSLFCEHAEVTPDGIVYILRGGYSYITFQSFPGIIRHLVLVSRVMFEPDECERKYKWVVRAVGPKGNAMASTREITFDVQKNKIDSSYPSDFTICSDFSGFDIYEPGNYTFKFIVDDSEIGQAILSIAHNLPGAGA
jgi:hypothetical protein